MSNRGRIPKQRLGFYTSESFLRSINLAFDIDVPERIAHFQPTSKSAILFSSILGLRKSRAFLVIAPYGSGKSITSTAAIHLLENRADSQTTLKEISQRWRGVDSNLYSFSKERLELKGSSRGLALTISGYAPNLSSALITSLRASLARGGFRQSERFLKKLNNLTVTEVLRAIADFLPKLIQQGVDRIAIVWDEFGRHLEGIVESGETASLDDVQVLAEFASRYFTVPLTFTVLMHQSLLNYAINLPQSSKREWKKIEGRFESIQYIDDSKEIYKLVSKIIASQRKIHIDNDKLASVIATVQPYELYGSCTPQEIEEIVVSSYPLEPFALYLLPRVSARVAQNERTVFSFIFEKLKDESLGPSELYDYFSDDMRSDTALGGTYRQWLETQSALSKASSEIEIKILKTACLLGLGISGERSQCSRQMLVHAAAGFEKPDIVEKSIDNLLEKKLLLFRKTKDSISIWHGADLDLRGKLEEEKNELAPFFNVCEFINTDLAPEPQKPLRYNAQFHITRYFSARYIDFKELKKIAANNPSLFLPNDADGYIYYIIVKSDEERFLSLQIIEGLRNLPNRIVFCVPDKYRDFSDAALEVACLNKLSTDHFLLNEDPMIAPELKIMLMDAQSHLLNLLSKTYAPRYGGSIWIAGGEAKVLKNYQHLREFLSDTMEKAYSLTPKISNEIFVRKTLRQNLVNSRRKFIFALLEQYGDPTLGLQGYTPDVSLFRTFMLNTGLYQEHEQGHYSFVAPDRLADKGMKEVWTIIKRFYTEPSQEPKSLRVLFSELISEPFGVRPSLLPIFLAAGYKAFPHAIEIKKNSEYLPDILPSTIEDMCAYPDLYSFVVYSLDFEKQEYLRRIIALFSGNSAKRINEHELLRSAYDSIIEWKLNLPPAALEMKLEQDDARSLQVILRRNPDPYELFIVQLPNYYSEGRLFNYSQDKMITRIELAKRYIEDVQIDLYNKAASSFAAAFELDLDDTRELPKCIMEWIASLPQNIEDTFTNDFLKGFFERLRRNYPNTESLLNSISSYLIGSTIRKWGDQQLRDFRIKLQIVRDEIEDKAMLITTSSENSQNYLATKLLESRLIKIKQQLLQIGNEDMMRELFLRVLEKEIK